MKKIISLFALAAFVLVGFSSCDYDGKDDAYVTHYVSIDLKEGDTYLVAKGSTYTDPGYTATEGTEDVTVTGCTFRGYWQEYEGGGQECIQLDACLDYIFPGYQPFDGAVCENIRITDKDNEDVFAGV